MEKINFYEILKEIKDINKLETKGLKDKLLKFNEEYGELNAEVIKKLGLSYKEYDENHLKEEMADTLQCLLSIYEQIFTETNITFQDILDEIRVKDKKWLDNIEKYKINK
jgi:NTP pyrophosphatase (non-canonical NTP hydrolase)